MIFFSLHNVGRREGECEVMQIQRIFSTAIGKEKKKKTTYLLETGRIELRLINNFYGHLQERKKTNKTLPTLLPTGKQQ